MEYLKKGDNFIRVSKYGSVTGVVKEISETNVIAEKCNYVKLVVESTNGVFYDYNECFRITKILNDDEINNRKKFMENLDKIIKRKNSIELTK
jgi:hypothetical protein